MGLGCGTGWSPDLDDGIDEAKRRRLVREWMFSSSCTCAYLPAKKKSTCAYLSGLLYYLRKGERTAGPIVENRARSRVFNSLLSVYLLPDLMIRERDIVMDFGRDIVKMPSSYNSVMKRATHVR